MELTIQELWKFPMNKQINAKFKWYKKANYYIMGILFMSLSCNEAKNEYLPTFETTGKEVRIEDSYNFFTSDSELSELLLENELKKSDLSDLYSISDHKVLLLFRPGVIIELSDDGSSRVLIGSKGIGPGEFDLASKLKLRNNHIYILDRNSSKISKYDLEGNFIKDIILRIGLNRSFEVSSDGNIILFNFYSSNNASLLSTTNEDGKIVSEVGDINLITPILKEIENIPAFLIDKIPNSNFFLFTSVLTGDMFIYDISSSALISSFSIRRGPEWDAMVDFEKNLKKSNSQVGFFRKIEDVDFFPDGRILISWGGPFNEKRTISMIYNKNGTFSNRVFQSDSMWYRPTLISVDDDNYLWVYSRKNESLFKSRLVKN